MRKSVTSGTHDEREVRSRMGSSAETTELREPVTSATRSKMSCSVVRGASGAVWMSKEV